jgi:hypothetical protein
MGNTALAFNVSTQQSAVVRASPLLKLVRVVTYRTFVLCERSLRNHLPLVKLAIRRP